MTHKCAKPGCCFHLPWWYVLPYCPWHCGKLPAMAVAGGIFAVGVGSKYAADAIRNRIKRKRTEAEQDQWRKKVEEKKAAGTPEVGSDNDAVA